MRVGICGCYDNHNYGSMLQAYANERAIEQLGHECEFIRYQKRYTAPEALRQAPRVFNSAIIRSELKVLSNRRLAKKYPHIQRLRKRRDASFDSFCKARFQKLSETCVGYAALEANSERYDAVLAGSDQLWLPMGLPTNFFNLQFARPGIRRISYATSFGVSSIPWYQKGRTADYLRRIDFLSTREESGARIIRNVAGLEAKVVVDPTLLLTGKQWMEEVPARSICRFPYIFCYYLGSNPLCRTDAVCLSRKTGLPIVTLRHLDEIIPTDEGFGDMAPYDIDPGDFVNLIRGAEVVLTDSFHGSVFSILNHKRFATYYRFAVNCPQSRNSRIDNLFAHLGLESHLITGEGELDGVIGSNIDYKRVEARLKAWRAVSWDFLTGALS